jgi:hypothetical protein
MHVIELTQVKKLKRSADSQGMSDFLDLDHVEAGPSPRA